jgi:hydrogenase maturation protease
VSDFWAEQARPAPASAEAAGRTIRKGSLVRLRPKAGGDVFDLALADRLAVVESIEQDAEGRLHVTVTLEDDPGRDLGAMRALGHRFFFGVDEVEPVDDALQPPPGGARILVAGIGNVFLGDDGFGVEVAGRLRDVPLPDGVEVRDFGIRGMDLAYALQEDYEAVVLVDAAPRGEAPGTVSLVEPDLEAGDEVVLDTHGMDPLRVLALARAMGRVPERVLVVVCEPQTIVHGEHDDELVGELSEPVRAGVDEAVAVVRSLVEELKAELGTNRKAVSG